MKLKRILSALCAVAIMATMTSTLVSAEEEVNDNITVDEGTEGITTVPNTPDTGDEDIAGLMATILVGSAAVIAKRRK